MANHPFENSAPVNSGTPATFPPPSVAVAIACFNQGRFLGQAIESALRQTRPPLEIIVIDDGSTDCTREVAARFPDVRYLHQANAGLSAARNAGLAAARAGRILFLDADDWLLPVALGAAATALDATPGAAFAHGGYQEVAEDGTVLSTHAPRPAPRPFLQLLRGNHVAMHGTVLYDAALLRAGGGFDSALPACEDYDVYLRLARDHAVAAYPEIAACYRRHGDSLSRDRFKMIEISRRVIDRHVRRARDAEEVRAARTGRAAMTGYYAAQVVADLRSRRASGRLGDALVALLASAAKRPAASAHALRWLAGRVTRAATTTG